MVYNSCSSKPGGHEQDVLDSNLENKPDHKTTIRKVVDAAKVYSHADDSRKESALGQLEEELSALTAEDCGLLKPESQRVLECDEIVFQQIYSCQDFLIGVFILPANKNMPLHDHPGMTVMSKLLKGRMLMKSFDHAEVTSLEQMPKIVNPEQVLVGGAKNGDMTGLLSDVLSKYGSVSEVKDVEGSSDLQVVNFDKAEDAQRVTLSLSAAWEQGPVVPLETPAAERLDLVMMQEPRLAPSGYTRPGIAVPIIPVLPALNTELNEADGLVHTLRPNANGNIHEFKALTPCAIIDVLLPPYKKSELRDCHYFREMKMPNGQYGLIQSNPPAGFRVVSGTYRGDK